MKLILLLGVFVFLEIATCSDVHNKIKSRLKKDHDAHKKSAHHDIRKTHKVNNQQSPRAPPSARDGQDNFRRYLEKWEKFSKPGRKWHPELKKTDKKNPHETEKVKKDEKLHPDSLKHIKHKLSLDQINKKNEKFAGRQNRDHPKGKFSRKNNRRNNLRMQLGRRFSPEKHGHDYAKKLLRIRQKSHEDRQQKQDNHRRMQLKPLGDHKLDGKQRLKIENRMKDEQGHRQLHRKTSSFGRPGHGPKPFARGTDKRFGPKSSYCMKRQNRKCPDYKRQVCGSDGKTYQNRCLFMKEMCKKDSKTELKLLKRGECDVKILH